MRKDINLIIQEIEKHKERVLYTAGKIKAWNLTGEILENPEVVETIDSFIFRFSKMQDSMSQKLFPAVLELLEEDVRDKSFIDILNRMEQLNLIPSANEWKKLRELRNHLTHAYPWEKEILLEGIKEALNKYQVLIDTFEAIKDRVLNEK
ncbi:MAG: hypothetical protein GXO18_05465 [Aquificae bacterium]|nr:hypothetical protein [Aquificota bacterium]